jgi:hypothetical protein
MRFVPFAVPGASGNSKAVSGYRHPTGHDFDCVRPFDRGKFWTGINDVFQGFAKSGKVLISEKKLG